MVKRTRKSTVPKDETKADKFRRLANQRLRKAIKEIEAIGKLAAVSYESTPDQIGKIVAALNAAVTRVDKAFTAGGSDVPII
jgi:hypothetical protein